MPYPNGWLLLLLQEEEAPPATAPDPPFVPSPAVPPWLLLPLMAWADQEPTGASRAFTAAAAAGSFTLTGRAATPLYNRRNASSAGSFTVSGQVATLSRSSAAVSANPGSFVVTGKVTTNVRAYLGPATVGHFTLTGAGAATRVNRFLAGSAGSFVVSGGAAGFAVRMPAAAGSFAWSGLPAALGSFTVLAAPRAFALTGGAAAFKRTYDLAAMVGPFSVTGRVAALHWSGETTPAPPVTTSAINFLHVRTFDVDFRLSSGGSVDF